MCLNMFEPMDFWATPNVDHTACLVHLEVNSAQETLSSKGAQGLHPRLSRCRWSIYQQKRQEWMDDNGTALWRHVLVYIIHYFQLFSDMIWYHKRYEWYDFSTCFRPVWQCSNHQMNIRIVTREFMTRRRWFRIRWPGDDERSLDGISQLHLWRQQHGLVQPRSQAPWFDAGSETKGFRNGLKHVETSWKSHMDIKWYWNVLYFFVGKSSRKF